MILNSKHHCDDDKFSELSNSESDNSSIFGNNRNSVSENSAADTMPTPVALTVPKQDLVNQELVSEISDYTAISSLIIVVLDFSFSFLANVGEEYVFQILKIMQI